MTNQSIKLNREIAREKKVSPEESDHIWECNEIRQATASETTEMYCALKSCRTRTCGGSAQPLLHALSLASETCVVLSLGLELELQIKGNQSNQGNESSVGRMQCEHACPEGCCAGNGMFFSTCIFKAWARPGQPGQTIYWQANISTASTAEQRILRLLNISYPLDELGFA